MISLTVKESAHYLVRRDLIAWLLERRTGVELLDFKNSHSTLHQRPSRIILLMLELSFNIALDEHRHNTGTAVSRAMRHPSPVPNIMVDRSADALNDDEDGEKNRGSHRQSSSETRM